MRANPVSLAWSRVRRGKLIAVDRIARGEQPARSRRLVDVVVVAPPVEEIEKLVAALGERGMHVVHAFEPDLIAAAVVSGRPDGALIDLRFGELGERTLSWLSRNSACATAVISTLPDFEARVRALDFGAVDHLVAPFDVREAIARVEMLLTRRRSGHVARLEAGDLTVDVGQRQATRNGQPVLLTPREVDVLTVLMRRHDRPVSKRDLLVEVWQSEARSENVVEANVSSLRRKLHAIGPPIIHTVHRTGYVFRPTSHEAQRQTAVSASVPKTANT